jgi:hypothetical protein
MGQLYRQLVSRHRIGASLGLLRAVYTRFEADRQSAEIRLRQWLWPPAANFVELQYNCLTDHRCTGWAWPAFRELVRVGASCTHLADDAGDRAAPPAPTLRHAGVDTRGNARGNQICAFTNWPCISLFHNLFRYPVSQFFSVESAIFPMNLATYGIRAEPASAVPPARRQQGLGLNYSA